jgi:hypothetical protein
MVAAAVVGSAVVGGVVSSNAASSAADAQTQAANQADATQRYMYDQTRADNAPFLQTGTAANSKLAYLLGIGGSPTGSYSSSSTLTPNDLVDTSSGDWKPNAQLYATDPAYKSAWDSFIAGHIAQFGDMPNSAKGSDLAKTISALSQSVDLNSYNQQQQNQVSNDPNYGSLLKSFSAQDLANDPIYQSTYQNALDTGTKAANQQASATGSLLSGNTLKALTRFGANTAATYGNDAYNRYNTNQTNTYNRLAGVSGTGQTAAAQVGASGQNTANAISNNQTALGNARGASAIAQGNAFNNALSTGVNAYQNQSYLNSLNSGYQQAPAPVTNLDTYS